MSDGQKILKFAGLFKFLMVCLYGFLKHVRFNGGESFFTYLVKTTSKQNES